MTKRLNKSGYTLMEMMIVIAIMGIVILSAPRTFTKVYQFIQLSTARIEIQKNARSSLANINKDLRQAQARSVVIDSLSGQPPHSKISFKKYNPSGILEEVSYFQKGNQLFMATGGSTTGKLICNYLRYIAFTYMSTEDAAIISISITFEKATYEGGTKALQMAVEKVRIMN